VSTLTHALNHEVKLINKDVLFSSPTESRSQVHLSRLKSRVYLLADRATPDEDITVDISAKSWFDTDYKPSTAQGTMANAGIWYQPSRCEFNTIRRNVVIPF
jgi:hypothetical protein